MTLSFYKSEQLYKQAEEVVPMIAQSKARVAFLTGNYNGYIINYPKFFDRGEGSHLFDVDGNEFIDYHCAFGPVILGHAHPRISEAIKKQVDRLVIVGAEPQPPASGSGSFAGTGGTPWDSGSETSAESRIDARSARCGPASLTDGASRHPADPSSLGRKCSR